MGEFNTIQEAIEDFKAGKMVIMVDDEDRENEGDLCIPAEFATAENINYMIKHGRGLVCVPMKQERLDELGIKNMVTNNTDPKGTAFMESVDHIDTETGISAFERSLTIKKLVDDSAAGSDFTRPGHIFPLRYTEGGVLKRAGHTEAVVDLSVLAGMKPAGVICEIIREDGEMARVPDLMKFKEEHDIKIVTIKDLIEYRRKNESLIDRVTEAEMPTKHGNFKMVGFIDKTTGEHHIALVKGDVSQEGSDDAEPVLVRVHSECLTGDAFGSCRCDCGTQLDNALDQINKKGRGILVYMRQEGRGIGLINKIKAYALQDQGYDTVEANVMLGFEEDLRDYGIGAQIIRSLGVSRIELMTNNPKKIIGIEGYGIEVVRRVPVFYGYTPENKCYLETKKDKMGHIYEEEA